jgi:hypothetical protein
VCTVLALVLIAEGKMSAAERCCTETLARRREAGDLQAEAALLTLLADLALDAGRVPPRRVTGLVDPPGRHSRPRKDRRPRGKVEAEIERITHDAWVRRATTWQLAGMPRRVGAKPR